MSLLRKKNDWKLRIMVATSWSRFIWKMACKLGCACLCVSYMQILVFLK